MSVQLRQLKQVYKGIARELRVNVEVSVAFDAASGPVPPQKTYSALWDTGATNVAVSKKLIAELQLPQTGVAPVHTANGTVTAPTYLIALVLPGGVRFNGVRVTAMDLDPSLDMLIGMDVIGAGDFCVTNVKGVTHVHFQVPSLGIGALHQGLFAQQNLPPVAPGQVVQLPGKVGRNEPCPCGSGKKYKRCCGFGK